MLKLLFTLSLLVSFPVFSECSYCTSLEEGLENPEKVTFLDLSAQGYVAVPEEINEFTSLISLDLSDNLIGEIDFPAVKLGVLEHLNLSNNPGFNTMELTGMNQSFPSLQKLELRSNSIKYVSPEISKLNRLQELDLSDNAIGYLPNEMERMTELTYLDLTNNALMEAFWLKGLWNIEHIKVNGNPNLDLTQLGMALLFKTNIKSVSLSPDPNVKGVPTVFSELAMNTFVLSGGDLNKINSRICRNKNIRHLVLEGFENILAEQFVNWINRFSNLSSIEFRSMTVPTGLDEIVNVKEMRFVSCDFQDKQELRKVNPMTDITAVDTDIKTEGYLGNAKIATLIESEKILMDTPCISKEMKENNLETIVAPETQVIKFSASTPKKIALGFSEYNIPSDAFLTKDGAIYKGEVEVKVIEYADPILNALSGVPMTFTTKEGEDKIFASSGMIDFKAYDDQGNELDPNPSNIIQVTIEDLQPSEDSQLYALDEETRVWAEIGVPEPTDYSGLKKRFLDSLNQVPDEDIVKFNDVQIGIDIGFKKSSKDPYELYLTALGKKSSVKELNHEKDGNTAHTANVDQRWIAGLDWKIDTVITPEIKVLLDGIKSDQRKNSRYWKTKNWKIESYIPRLISDLKLTPNFEHDNYILTFLYKDSAIRLPIYPSFGGSINRIQTKEKKNWKVYEKKMAEAVKERDLVDKYKKDYIAKQADVVREQRALFLARNEEYRLKRKEELRFGLTSFGVFNCDYFTRNVPDEYMAFDTAAVDVNGYWVMIPNEIRNVMLDDNSYVATTRSNVPIYKKQKSIMMFTLGIFEIAVVKGWEKLKNGLMRPKVERFSSEGMTPDEVRDRVLILGKE